MKKEKVINQAALPNDKFIIVDYFKKIDEVMNTPCRAIEFMKGKTSVGMWKIKSLKN